MIVAGCVGAVLVAIYSFTSVLILALVGDARVVLSGALSGVARISRHLWRMCLGLTLAAGSGFTNGFARLLPGPRSGLPTPGDGLWTAQLRTVEPMT
jgi:hypothetical protein